MGFKETISKLIEHLDNGYYVLHEECDNIDIKNLLSTNVVTLSDVTSIVEKTRERNYSCSTHHLDEKVDVHLITTIHSGRDLFIKWYFIEPDRVFISVHY